MPVPQLQIKVTVRSLHLKHYSNKNKNFEHRVAVNMSAIQFNVIVHVSSRQQLLNEMVLVVEAD